jgi:hypothetical protein
MGGNHAVCCSYTGARSSALQQSGAYRAQARNILRYARAFPPGAERNQHRQIALSLRALFKNKKWLDTHTLKGSDE